MKQRKDYLAVITIILLCITTISGIFSLDFSHSHNFINQYGQKVTLYGYGIYAFDTYFKAPISIGTDVCILFVLVPLFVLDYIKYRVKNDVVSELKLITVYAVSFYYAASMAFGVTYNRLFLIYLLLFSCSLFGMFAHIRQIRWNRFVSITKGAKVFLVCCGLALIVAWLPDVIPSLVNSGTLSQIGVYTTEITYVLDMGIISPLCFVCIYLSMQKNPLGTLIYAILLKACMIVGIMMIPQTVCQIASGIELPIPALVTKSMSFILLGGCAIYLNQNLYRRLNNEER